MFKFTQEHFRKCVGHPLFEEGYKLAVQLGFDWSPKFRAYHGDRKLLEPFKHIHQQDWEDKRCVPTYQVDLPIHGTVNSRRGFINQIFKDKPFPYFGYYENPRYREYFEYELEVYSEALEHRSKLLTQAIDHYEPTWYFLHDRSCTMTLFIVYPMLRILFPHMKLYFVKDMNEWLICNSQTPPTTFEEVSDVDVYSKSVTFDLNTQLDYVDEMILYEPQVIEEKDIAMYYVGIYCNGNVGWEEDIDDFLKRAQDVSQYTSIVT